MLTIRRTRFFGHDLFLLISLIFTIFALAILIPAFNGTSRESRYSLKWKVILFYTKIFSVRPTSIWSATSLQSCPVPWCIISDDKELLRDSDAVIFHGRDMPRVLPTERSSNQRWVYFVQENPHYTSPEPSKYNGVFNWTMTYKRSSDVWVPYGSYRTIQNTSLLGKHNSLAGWWADRCFTFSKLYSGLSPGIKKPCLSYCKFRKKSSFSCNNLRHLLRYVQTGTFRPRKPGWWPGPQVIARHQRFSVNSMWSSFSCTFLLTYLANVIPMHLRALGEANSVTPC